MFIELLQFLGIVLLLEVTPGPAVLFIMFQSAKFGMKHAFAGILGLVTANIAWISLVASGLGLLLQQSPTMYQFLKNIGVVYLLYLGGKILFNGIHLPEGDAIKTGCSLGKVYLQGILTSLTNPKALLFFLALLPHFATEASFISDLVFWGAIKILCLVSVMSTYAIVGTHIFSTIKQNPLADKVSRVFGLGIIVAAFGVAQS